MAVEVEDLSIALNLYGRLAFRNDCMPKLCNEDTNLKSDHETTISLGIYLDIV